MITTIAALTVAISLEEQIEAVRSVARRRAKSDEAKLLRRRLAAAVETLEYVHWRLHRDLVE